MIARLRVLAAGFASVVALLGSGAPSAWADASADSPAGAYTGQTSYYFHTEGYEDSETFSDEVTYFVECAGDQCSVAVYIAGSIEFDAPVRPESETVTEFPSAGDECAWALYGEAHPDGPAPEEGDAAYYRSGATITTNLSGGTLSLIADETPSHIFDCGGTSYVSMAEHLEFTGVLEATSTAAVVDDGSEPAGTTPSYWLPATAPLTIDEPSVLSGTPTIAEAITPERVGVAVTGAIVLALLMAFPSRLLSGARDRLVERAKAWWKKRRAAQAAAAGKPAPVEKPARVRKPYEGWLLAIAGLLVASVIAVFVDPRAGFDGGTLRLLGSVFVAFLAEVALGWFVLIFVVRRANPGTHAWFTFKPWLLLAVVGAVLFARLTGLQPGIAFGAVAVVAFAAILNDRDRARFTFVGLAYAFGLSLVAWVGYSLLAGMFGSTPEAWLLFVQESLAAATVAGISLLPLLLIPVRGMPGSEIFGWNRIVWGVSYLLGLVAFLLVLLPLPTSWNEVAVSFWAWVGLFVLYAVAATVVWLVVTKPWKPVPATAA